MAFSRVIEIIESPFLELRWFISNRFFRKRWMLSTGASKSEWLDDDARIELALMKCLVDFIEVECANAYIEYHGLSSIPKFLKWKPTRNADYGILYLQEQMRESEDKAKDKRISRMLVLYKQITIDLPDMEQMLETMQGTYEKYSEKEKQIKTFVDKMLHEIIDLRKDMWT